MLKTAKEISCLLFNHAQKSLTSGFFVPHRLFFVHLHCSQSSDLVFRTTVVEDTHLSLAVIPVKVGANDSLIFCYYKHTRKNLPGFRSCYDYNSLIPLSNIYILKSAYYWWCIPCCLYTRICWCDCSTAENQQKLSEREIELGIAGTKNSWHNIYRESAWIFVGGLPFDLTEGDVICIFSQ